MNRLWLLFAVLVVCTVTAAADDKPWTVEGDVVDDAGPVQAVDILTTGFGRASTDANGHYVLKGTRLGSFSIRPRKNGYDTALATHARQVSVLAGARVERVDFRIHRESAISGRVLDRDGNPVGGAPVVALAKVFRDGSPTFRSPGEATTNDLGEYRIAGLGEGPYYLVTYPPGLQSRRPAPGSSKPVRKPQLVMMRTFYPNSLSLEGGAPIYLRPGERREGIDVNIGAANAFCVSGTLGSDWAGEAPGVANLVLAEPIAGGLPTIAHRTPKPGEDFEVCGVPPGSYTLLITISSRENSAKVERLAKSDVVVADRDVKVGVLNPIPCRPCTAKPW